MAPVAARRWRPTTRAASVALATVVAACAGTAPPPARRVVLNAPGELVDIEASLVADHVTIVDFRADWCHGCAVMEERFTAVIGDDPRVVVRVVDVGEGATPVARRYEVGALPHLRLYDRHRRLRYVLAGNDALTAGDLALELAREP